MFGTKINGGIVLRESYQFWVCSNVPADAVIWRDQEHLKFEVNVVLFIGPKP